MVHLTETEPIELLMIIIAYGDKRRSLGQVVTLFNEMHPDRETIPKLTVSRTLRRFNETGESVKERPKPCRPKTSTNDENALNVLLVTTENPTTSVQQLALNHNVSRKSVEMIMNKEKFHPYKIHLVQELNEDNFDR